MLYDMLVARSDGQGQQTLDIIVLMNSFRAQAQDFGLKAPKNKHDSNLAFRYLCGPLVAAMVASHCGCLWPVEALTSKAIVHPLAFR